MDLVMTLQTPGWSLIERRIKRMAAESVKRLCTGGKDRHDVNLGHLQGVEDVLKQSKVWFEEAQAFISKERA